MGAATLNAPDLAVLLRTQEPRVAGVVLAALGSCFRRNTKGCGVRAWQ
ncbi:MAG: hypothetical protein JWR80_120 [Bradyrhizobium sp.]|nr:hypothetical protein [Bradyrhizobium sp.]